MRLAALEDFTTRQRQIMKRLADGLKYGAIASELGISVRTVRVHACSAADRVGYTHLPAQAALRQFMRDIEKGQQG